MIRAGHVVLATGYELAEGVPAEGHGILSTWAIELIATELAGREGPDADLFHGDSA